MRMHALCVCVRKCVLFSRYFSDYAVITVTAFSVIRTQVTKTLKPLFTIPERKKRKNTNKCVHVEN